MNPPHAVARVVLDAERQLSPAEFEAYVNTPMTDAERDETRALVAWFTRRYPTGADRLAYVRRAYRRWQRPGHTTKPGLAAP